ncbi:MAG: DUF4954 family protein [Planctomycetota bacterium]
MTNQRSLKDSEKKQLEAQNCRATDWSKVLVADPFDAARVRNSVFIGEVRLGVLTGNVKRGGIEELCGIYDATLANVSVGDGCLINRVGSRIVGYEIGDGAIIEDVGLLACEVGTTFGCGTSVDAVNEGGGRGVKLYPELSANVAHILAMHRYRPKLIEQIESLIAARIARSKADRGVIGAGAVVRGVKTMRNVTLGPAAKIEDAAVLENGTILSEVAAPTTVGSGVIAHDFIIAEGSSVTDGAILANTYVGQGVKMGKQFSAENCLLFANCEAFHGEGVALFGGPYTVSHHKSTLLIAAHLSFYNAGSGTNQSNHMYKLGPLHQGILERGSKTGSFSYMLWPCRVGPFSVVIGKHMANFDLTDLPFSYIDAHENKSVVKPGFNLYTVGTVRDGAKWPARDRRKGSVKRDLISFAMFNPYIVGRLLRGEKLLAKLSHLNSANQEIELNGATISNLLDASVTKLPPPPKNRCISFTPNAIKYGSAYYQSAIDSYLAEKLVTRAEAALDKGLKSVQQRLAPDSQATQSCDWLDIGGLLVARDRFEKFAAEVELGAVKDLDALQARLTECQAAYEQDEWNWVAAAWEERFKIKPCELTGAALAEVAEKWNCNRSQGIKMILADAEKEFSDTAQVGFGVDGNATARKADFESVRGIFAKNKFVMEMNAELVALNKRVVAFKARTETLK